MRLSRLPLTWLILTTSLGLLNLSLPLLSSLPSLFQLISSILSKKACIFNIHGLPDWRNRQRLDVALSAIFGILMRTPALFREVHWIGWRTSHYWARPLCVIQGLRGRSCGGCHLGPHLLRISYDLQLYTIFIHSQRFQSFLIRYATSCGTGCPVVVNCTFFSSEYSTNTCLILPSGFVWSKDAS